VTSHDLEVSRGIEFLEMAKQTVINAVACCKQVDWYKSLLYHPKAIIYNGCTSMGNCVQNLDGAVLCKSLVGRAVANCDYQQGSNGNPSDVHCDGQWCATSMVVVCCKW